MSRKPTPAPRRAETFNERTDRINRESEDTNRRTGATDKPMSAPRRAPAPPQPPSRYGPSRVPGNVPRPAAGPTDARDPRSIPLGSGALGNARNVLVNRRERIDEEVNNAAGKPKPAATPRPRMAGGGMVKGKPCGHKRK
ncbi:MAG: hypothetical protein RLZZ598_731 [Pseudomonadota bacterium]|jgi:hypothetical protein